MSTLEIKDLHVHVETKEGIKIGRASCRERV